MTETEKLKAVIQRCLDRLVEYEGSFSGLGEGEFLNPNHKHAGAYRATMDLTRQLAAWRRTLANGWGPK